MKHPLLLVLLVLMVGAGIALLTFGDEQPELRSAPGVSVTASAVTVDDGEVAAAELTVAAVDAADAVPEELLRDEVAGEEAPSGRPLVIQVWRGKKGVPAPAAEVFVVAGSDELKSRDPFAPHLSALADQKGWRFDADAFGRAELPPVQDWSVVSARLPGEYGFAVIRSNHRAVEAITLRPDETVTVRVTDSEGRPVSGAPVGILQAVPRPADRKRSTARLKDLEQNMRKVRQWMNDNPAQRGLAEAKMQSLRQESGRLRRQVEQAGGNQARGRAGAAKGRGNPAPRAVARAKAPKKAPALRDELRVRRRTDAQGLAVFEHFQLHRGKNDKSLPKDQSDRFKAALLMPLLQPETRAFGGRPVSEDVIELRLPACGSIALRTVDRDGRPFTHPVQAQLRIEGGGDAPWSRVNVRKQQNEDAIVFPFVGLGLRFSASCQLDDKDFRWSVPRFAGPAAPDQRVEIDLVVAPEEGMLFGRLFDAAGRPLADEAITFLINGRAGRLEGEQVLLDRDGRFHLPYQMRPQHQPPFRLQIRRPGVVPVAGLGMPLATLPRAHVTDIGELRLDSLGAAAHGVVVDDRGVPIPGARVQLQRERSVGQQKVKLEWREEAFASAVADEDGRYALFGELEQGRYRLHVEAKEHFPLETEGLRRDGQPTELRLLRRSRLVGTMLRPEWLPAKSVRAELRLSSDPKQRREDRIRDARGQTFAYFDWVRPGVYDLAFRVRQFPDPFLRIEGLVIEPGQVGVHPRLVNLDLGSSLYRFEVAARDENGEVVQPKRPLLASIQRPDGSASFIGVPWQKGGRLELLSTSPQARVIPMHEGYAIEPAVISAGRSELLFRSIPPVDLQFAGLGALAGAVRVQVILELQNLEGLPQKLETFDSGSRRIAGWYARAKYSAAMLEAGDTARLRLMRGGRHRITLRFGSGQGIRPTSVRLPSIDLELVPGAGPRRYPVSYDAQVVQQAIADAAQRMAQKQQR